MLQSNLAGMWTSMGLIGQYNALITLCWIAAAVEAKLTFLRDPSLLCWSALHWHPTAQLHQPH